MSFIRYFTVAAVLLSSGMIGIVSDASLQFFVSLQLQPSATLGQRLTTPSMPSPTSSMLPCVVDCPGSVPLREATRSEGVPAPCSDRAVPRFGVLLKLAEGEHRWQARLTERRRDHSSAWPEPGILGRAQVCVWVI